MKILHIKLSSVALALLLALTLYEDADGGRQAMLWLSLAALMWERRRLLDWAVWRRAAAIGAGAWLTIALAAAAIARLHLLEAPFEIAGDALKRLLPFAIGIPSLAVLVIGQRRCMPFIPRIDRSLWLVLAAWSAWIIVCSITSTDPSTSFRFLYKEGLAYLLCLGLIWLKLTDDCGSRGRHWILFIVLLAGGVALADVALALAANFSPPAVAERLADAGAIRIDDFRSAGRVVRVQFPFREHNRLASWLLVGFSLFPLAVVLHPRRGTRVVILVAAGLILMAIGFTGTRGALVAAMAGCAIVIFVQPRLLVLLLPAAFLLYLFMPAGLRQHVENTFRPETFTDPLSSVSYRFVAWRIIPRMIADHPVTGIGYGWPVFEELYPRYDTENLDVERKPHAHNNFLEVTVETGFPGLMIFLAYHALLAWGALQLIRRGERGSAMRAAGWAILAALVMLHAFGMTNFSLRRSVGFSVWAAFGAIQALIATLTPPAPASGRPPGRPGARSPTTRGSSTA